MSKKKSIDGKATIFKDVHDLDSAALRNVEVQGGLDDGQSYYAETALITCTTTGASDVLYVSNDNTNEDIIINDITIDVFNSDGDTADITFVKNPTGFADNKSIALANSMKTVINAHFNDSGIESSAITLANSLKTVMNNHYTDSGAQSSAIVLANSLKTVLNAHYSDYGALTSAQTLANALKTSINNHFADSGALSSANTLANSLKTVINAHYNDSGAQSSAITLANSLKTVMNAHYNDDGNLVEAMALANSLKTVVNAHYSDYGALTSAIALANSLQGTLNDHYGVADAIVAANAIKVNLNAHYANADTSIIITRANALKVIYNNHVADATEHPAGADATVSTADATDLASAITLIAALLAAYDAHDADAELGAAWVYHEAQESSDHSLADATSPADITECISRLNDFRLKYNAHDADSMAHLLGGQHSAAIGTYPDLAAGEEHTDAQASISAADATDYATLITLVTALLSSYDDHYDDANLGAAWVYHQADEAAPHALVSAAAPTTLSECITRLNDLITKYEAHQIDSTAHTTGNENPITVGLEAGEKHQDWSPADTTTAASNLATLITLTDALITSYDTHDDDAEAVAAIHDATEASDHSLTSTAAATDLDDCISLLNDLKAKLNAHDADATAHPNDATAYQEATADADGEHQTLDVTVSAAAASDLATTLTLTGALLASYALHNTDSIQATPTIHIVQGTTHALVSEASPSNLYEAITRLNDLKAKYNLHEADTDSHLIGSQHTESTSDATAGEHIAPYANISAASASDLPTLITLLTAQLTAYDAHDVDANLGAAWVYHYADEGGAGSALADASAPTTLDECISRVNDLKAKYNAHDAYTTAHATGSLHQESNANADGEHLTIQANLSAANATDLGTLVTLLTAEMASYVLHNTDAKAGTPTYHILQDVAGNDLASETPPVTLDDCVARVNDLKAKYNAHDAETVNHMTGSQHQEGNSDAAGEHLTSQAAISAANATNLGTLLTLTNTLLSEYDAHDDDAELGSPTYHIVTEGTDATLISAAATTTLSEAMTALNDLKAKYNIHDADAVPHLTGNVYQNATAAAAGEHQTLEANVSAAAASNLATLITLTDALIASYDAHDNDAEQVTPTVHQLTEGADASLASAAAAADLDACISRLNDLKAKLNTHDADATAHWVGSQHQESNSDAAGEHLTTQANLSVANASNLTTLIALITAEMASYVIHNTDAKAGTPTYHIVQDVTGNDLASATPPTTLDLCVTRLNDLKSKYNAHDAETGNHLTGSVYQESTSDAGGEHLTVQANVSAANATNQATLITLVSALMDAYIAHNTDAIAVTPTYHVLTGTTRVLASEVDPTTFIEAVTRLNDLKAKYNLHDADTVVHQTGSDHQESTADGVGTEVTTHNLNFTSSNTSGVSVVSGDEADVLTGGTDFLTEYNVVEGGSFTIPIKLQLGPGDTLGIQIKPDAVTTNYQAKIAMLFQKIENEVEV